MKRKNHRKQHKQYCELSQHHRRPSSIGGKNTEDNISVLPSYLHRAWHVLFANAHAEEIAKIVNEHYLDRYWEFLVVPRRRNEILQ